MMFDENSESLKETLTNENEMISDGSLKETLTNENEMISNGSLKETLTNENEMISNDTVKQRMLVCVGVPGSGKTTFSKKLCQVDNDWYRINQDDLGSRRACEEVSKAQIKKGKNLIVDRCNFNREQRKTWIDLATRFNLAIDAIILDTPYEICKGRILDRKNHPTNVQGNEGLKILESFEQTYIPPGYNEGFERILSVEPHEINECNDNDVKEIMKKFDDIPKRVVKKSDGRGRGRGRWGRGGRGGRGGSNRGWGSREGAMNSHGDDARGNHGGNSRGWGNKGRRNNNDNDSRIITNPHQSDFPPLGQE